MSSILDKISKAVAGFSHPVLVYDASPPTITDGDVRVAQMGANGGMKVEIVGAASVAVSGGATETKQDTQITRLNLLATETTLAALSAKVTAVNTGAVVVSSLPATPAGSNTIGAVTGPAAAPLALDGTLTGGSQIANSSPSTPVSSGNAYEGSRVLKASAGTFRSLFVQLDPALAGGTYYVQLLTASAAVPGDGAVTFLRPPQTIVHTLGQAESANFYEGDGGIAFTVGCTACVSSTQFDKTEVASAALFAGSVL